MHSMSIPTPSKAAIAVARAILDGSGTAESATLLANEVIRLEQDAKQQTRCMELMIDDFRRQVAAEQQARLTRLGR